MNDLVWRTLGRANMPAVKEPAGILRSDEKRPHGLTQVPWQADRCMTSDVTVTDTIAESYITSASAGTAAEGAAGRKEMRCQTIARTHTFIPQAFETLGPNNFKGTDFLSQLGRRISACTGDMREKPRFYSKVCR